MASTHGKNTYISLGGTDISAYCDTSEFKRTAASHDRTGYGKDAEVKTPGLLGGTFTCGGWYDTTSSGPHDVINTLMEADAVCELIRRVEGTGSGKPQETVDLVITDFTETSPVADIVRWTLSADLSDDVVRADQ